MKIYLVWMEAVSNHGNMLMSIWTSKDAAIAQAVSEYNPDSGQDVWVSEVLQTDIYYLDDDTIWENGVEITPHR